MLRPPYGGPLVQGVELRGRGITVVYKLCCLPAKCFHCPTVCSAVLTNLLYVPLYYMVHVTAELVHPCYSCYSLIQWNTPIKMWQISKLYMWLTIRHPQPLHVSVMDCLVSFNWGIFTWRNMFGWIIKQIQSPGWKPQAAQLCKVQWQVYKLHT